MESQSDYSTRGCLLGKTVSPRLQQLEDDFIDNGGRFKEYKIKDLFSALKVSSKLSKLDISDEFTFPVYSSDSSNGGIYGYSNSPEFIVDDENNCYLVFGDHTRTFNIARQSFAVMDNVKVLKPFSKYWSDESLLYVATIWKKQIPNYGYSRHWKYAKSCLLKLPMYNGELAFDYMESYIRELEQERIRELEQERIRELDAYLKATGLNDYELTSEEKNSIEIMQNGGGKYKEFIIGDLFETFAGDVDLQNRDLTNTGEYFINSGVMNQGIKGRTTRKARIFDEGSLTIDFLGNCFYRDFKYKLATHNHVFSLQSDILKNQEISLYIAATFSYMKKSHSFNEMLTQTILKNYSIVLPVKDNDEIDYEFMDFFIKAVEKLCIKSVVDWKDRIIQTTKNVVNC